MSFSTLSVSFNPGKSHNKKLSVTILNSSDETVLVQDLLSWDTPYF